MRSRDTRLAVMLATAPDVEGDARVGDVDERRQHRDAHGARDRATVPPTSVRTRSMSWIIRSSTTATSEPRGLNGASRSLSMNRGRVDVRQRGADRAVEPLDVPGLDQRPGPLARSRAVRRPRPSVAAIGFSISRCMPRSSAAPRHRVVRRRRHDDRHRVHLVEQRVERRRTPARRAPCVTCAARSRVRLVEAGERHAPAGRAGCARGGIRAPRRRSRRSARLLRPRLRGRCRRRTARNVLDLRERLQLARRLARVPATR